MLGKRKTALFSFLIFTVSGILMNFSSSLVLVSSMRAVSGFCMGIVYAVAIALIAESYDDEKKMGAMMGIYNATMAAMGVVLSASAGYLALAGWTNIFKLYWISIPVLVMIILFVPEMKESGGTEGAVNESASPAREYGNPLLFIIAYFFFNLIYGVMNYYVAVYIAERGMGGSDVAGIVTSLQTVGSMIFCATFGLAFAKLKRKYTIFPWAVFTIGYLGLYVSHNLYLSAFLAIAMCAMYGGGQTFYISWIPLITDDSNRDRYVGLCVVDAGLGLFLSTYLVTFLQRILGTEEFAPTLPVLAAASLIFLVISVISIRTDTAKSKSISEQ